MCLAFFQVNPVWEKTCCSEKKNLLLKSFYKFIWNYNCLQWHEQKILKSELKMPSLVGLVFGERREVSLIKFNYIFVMFLRKIEVIFYVTVCVKMKYHNCSLILKRIDSWPEKSYQKQRLYPILSRHQWQGNSLITITSSFKFIKTFLFNSNKE